MTGHFQSRWAWPQGTKESLLLGEKPLFRKFLQLQSVENPLSLSSPASVFLLFLSRGRIF